MEWHIMIMLFKKSSAIAVKMFVVTKARKKERKKKVVKSTLNKRIKVCPDIEKKQHTTEEITGKSLQKKRGIRGLV